ncbi:hypothetical protein ACI79C_01720 [Geodermatophilus sp. SYSU D00697]
MDVTRGWSLRLVAGLAVGAAVLGGCSAEQEPADTLPSADVPVATEEELPPLGPEDLPMPDEARTQDAAGAEAFVRYYIDLINRTSTVMDAAPLREFSDGCRDCDRIATALEQDLGAGYRYTGGQLVITAIGRPLMKGATAEMAVRADQAPLVVLDSSGSPVDDLGTQAFPGLNGGAAIDWDSTRKSWSMTTLTLE